MTTPIKSLCCSCSFNCSVRNKAKNPIPTKASKKHYHKNKIEPSPYSCRSLLTAFQNEGKAQLTELLRELRRIFKHTTHLQLLSRRKKNCTHTKDRCSPSKKTPPLPCTTPFLKGMASLSLLTLSSLPLSCPPCEASSSNQQVDAWPTCLSGNPEKPHLSQVRIIKK